MGLPIDRPYLKRQLKNFDVDVLEKKYAQGAADLKIKKLDTAEPNFLATYELIYREGTADEAVLGAKINIPKDYLVRSATVETCTTPDVPVAGLEVGDKYLDFIINTKDEVDPKVGGTHIYIPFRDFLSLDAGDGIVITGDDIAVKYNKKGLIMQTVSGAAATDPKELAIYIGDGLAYGTADASGHQPVIINTGDGLEINASSKKVQVKTGDGLEIDSATGALKVKPGKGLKTDTTEHTAEVNIGEGLKFDTTSGKEGQLIPDFEADDIYFPTYLVNATNWLVAKNSTEEKAIS